MLSSNHDDGLSQRIIAIEKELASLVTAMGTLCELMAESKVENKVEREKSYEELRVWAQSNNSLLEMVSSATKAIDSLKRAIIEPSTSSTEQPKSSPNLEQTLTNFGKVLTDISKKIAQLSTTNQSQLEEISQSTSQHQSQLEQLKSRVGRGNRDKRQWIAATLVAILIIASTWMTISSIRPIATKTGWAVEKLGRIEKKMGIKTAADTMLRGGRMK
jgi:septal ring factor EnvC (AmiA/AmiB activator)